MAISKILYMKDCGGTFRGRHLKQAITYITVPEKTQQGRLIGGINCQPDNAFEQMMETKKEFGKVDKRQGYHLILSFQAGEVTQDTAFEITEKFVKEYLGSRYEAVYSVHDNTEHVHSHIVFNSVSFVDGRKYRYEKGDWAKEIQPITNRLCEEYGLSTIEIGDEAEEKDKNYKTDSSYPKGKRIWWNMIVRDVDACILMAHDFDGFLDLLMQKGYEIKQGKHLAVKPPGMAKYQRCYSLGAEYEEERIRERIKQENISLEEAVEKPVQARVIRCHVRRYKRAKLSGLQKKYYAKLYRTGRLIKKPYSQVWKYRDDIKKMKRLQHQYLFLHRHDISNTFELAATVDKLTLLKRESTSELSKASSAMAKCRSLFGLLERMELLLPAEESYKRGDDFFSEEHSQWLSLEEQLRKEGYRFDEVQNLRAHYRKELSEKTKKYKDVEKELKTARFILDDVLPAESSETDKEKQNITTEMSQKKQPEKEAVFLRR